MPAALIIFAVTYAIFAAGRTPYFRVDRAGAAVIGAALLIATRVLTLGQAFRAVDYRTIVLLFGMMILVANLRLSGAFALVNAWVVERTRRPIVLLAAITGVSGVLSAFFVNDAVCLVLAPLVLGITKALRREPLPYLLAVAMGSNVGSVATITGNPQNILIGSFSGIGYLDFARALSPVAAVGLVVVAGVISVAYRREFYSGARLKMEPPQVRLVRGLAWKSALTAVVTIALFFKGLPAAEVALVAGAFLLVTRRIKPERVYAEIDWSLLVMFTGLFVVVRGVQDTALFRDLPALAERMGLSHAVALSAASAVLANVVSNVPSVLLFRSIIPHLGNPRQGWLVLAMSATLAGNLTILGSVANLIVIQRVRREVHIGFWEYSRVGIPVTILTMAVGIFFLR